MSDVAKTPREELKCRKKYLYEHSMFFECNDGSKCQILEEDVCDLLNEADNRIESLKKRSRQLFIMEKVIDRMLSKEEQMEFYNMVELEMIKDE